MNSLPIYDIWRILSEPRDRAEGEIRAACRNVIVGENEALARILGRYKIYLDTRDIGIASHLLLDGFWEMWVTEAMMQAVRRGSVVADVGANLGYFTLLLADLTGAEGRVLSFEPNPDLSKLVRKSVEVNGFLPWTDFYASGLGSQQGWAQMDVRVDQPGGGRTLPIDGPNNGLIAAQSSNGNGQEAIAPIGLWQVIRQSFSGKNAGGSGDNLAENAQCEEPIADAVRILRFDELPHAREVEFMKIDVEGFEPSVWAGMTKRLENYDLPLTIFMEFTVERLEDPHGFLQEILDWGFSLEIIHFTEGVKAITPEEIFAGPHNVDHMLVFKRAAKQPA